MLVLGKLSSSDFLLFVVASCSGKSQLSNYTCKCTLFNIDLVYVISCQDYFTSRHTCNNMWYIGAAWYCAYTPPPPQAPHNAQSRQSRQPGHLYKKKNTYAKNKKKLEVKGVSGTYGNYIIRRVCYPIDKITKHYQDSSQITEHCVFTRDSCIPRLSLLPIVDTLISSILNNELYRHCCTSFLSLDKQGRALLGPTRMFNSCTCLDTTGMTSVADEGRISVNEDVLITN